MVKRVSFWAIKRTREPVVVKFRRSDGSIAKFMATKITTQPRKVVFYAKKKRYR